MFKIVFFAFVLGGCMKQVHPTATQKAGLHGFAGENFSSTNSPCLDGVITAMDHSCAVPMEIEEGYPYILIRCSKVRPAANPWDKYDILVITDADIEDPENATMMCVDPYSRVYIQKHP